MPNGRHAASLFQKRLKQTVQEHIDSSDKKPVPYTFKSWLRRNFDSIDYSS